MSRWIPWTLTAGTLLTGGLALSPQQALTDWRAAHFEPPTQILTGSPLDEALDLQLDVLELAHPPLAAALAQPTLDRWQQERPLHAHLGPSYADGVRALHVQWPCEGADPHCHLAATAQPARCAEASDQARCYFIDFESHPTHFAATLQLELVPPAHGHGQAQVHASGTVLALALPQRTLQSPLNPADLNAIPLVLRGLSLAQSLHHLGHPADLRAEEDGPADGWRFELPFEASGQLRHEGEAIRLADGLTQLTWRVGGAHCPNEQLLQTLETLSRTQPPTCLSAPLSAPLRWQARLADQPRHTTPATSSKAATTRCLDGWIQEHDLQTLGQACTLELVAEQSSQEAERPWRWAAGRARTPREHVRREGDRITLKLSAPAPDL